MSDVVIETSKTDTTVEVAADPPPASIVVLGDALPAPVEVIVAGPQGPPGIEAFHIGATPPADTSLIWIDTA